MTSTEIHENNVLREEAAFADAAYSSRQNELALPSQLFTKYFSPTRFWTYESRFRRLLGDLTGKAFLDLGCGIGQEAVFFAKLGAIVTAIDISRVGIDITRRRAEHNQVSVDARVMACPTAFPDESFDIVHGVGIIHHIGLDITLREVNRLLKRGGRAAFFEPMGNSATVGAIQGWLYPRLHNRLNLTDVTDHETVLRWSDIVRHRDDFSVFRLYPFRLLHRARKLFPRCLWTPSSVFDYFALTMLPPLRHFAGEVLIYLVK